MIKSNAKLKLAKKSDIIDAIQARMEQKHSKVEIANFMAAYHAEIESLLATGTTVPVGTLGRLVIKGVPTRNRRDPRTNTEVIVPAHCRLTFRASASNRHI